MTIAVFIVGRSGSGKTTLSKMLEHLGVFRISASAHLSRLYLAELGATPSRFQLADYGKTLLRQKRLESFHSALITEMARHEAACIDGLRFQISVDEISKHAMRTALVFLSCPTNLRRSRLTHAIKDEDLRVLNSHETEIAVDAMSSRADIRIDTSQPADNAFAQLKSDLHQLQII